jgi:uncharacterized protein (TIGR03790 family)
MRSGDAALSAPEFSRIYADVQRQTPANVQAYALTWLQPFRVECMSITAAFAFGFDRAYCSEGCKPTRLSPYFDSSSHRPYSDYGLRPAVSIAAMSVPLARQLIDRGVAADRTAPKGTAYLVSTPDLQRNVRAASYALTAFLFGDTLTVRQLHADGLRDAQDVMFYLIGARTVDGIDTNHFRPGALADHLTSTGGVLVNGQQMSSLRWLEAGATGSYGTVIEPCNFPGKFPDPIALLRNYLAGDTLLEAYWKSVRMPGQGIFIGEPLARPYGR